MLLRGRWIRRLTFLIVRPESMPAYFTFRERFDYAEDPVIRYARGAVAVSACCQPTLTRIATPRCRCGRRAA